MTTQTVDLIELLRGMVPAIHKRLIDPSNWDSLVINRRKPHTYRAFAQIDDYRVCLHRFEPCGPDDCFKHPHPWPASFLVLEGEYVHNIGYSSDLTGDPVDLYREVIRPYSMYEIVDRQTWHSVQPLRTTYTIMLNGEPWENAHASTRTTKGKDLQQMTDSELADHLLKFNDLINCYSEWVD